jgi:hypothetical protein
MAIENRVMVNHPEPKWLVDWVVVDGTGPTFANQTGRRSAF